MYFSEKEFMCKCGCGVSKMQPKLITKLCELRERLNRPVVLTSAYRCSKHPVEASKATPGQHNRGTAVDIKVSNGSEAYEVMKVAFELGFTGIALGRGFVHVDVRDTIPVSWVY